MSELSIEKGVPMPETRSGWGKFGNTIREMEVGDSVVVKKQVDVCNLQATSRRLDRRMASRKVDGGWRVWRIK